jgi:hypothetical protein
MNSCFKQDIPVKPFDRGDTKVAIIPMSPDYSHQFYYKFESNSIVKDNPYDIWDLAFQCYGDDFYILLNGAKFMEAANMGEVSFESVKDRSNSEFKYDSTNGKYNDYSIGKWWNNEGTNIISKNHIYIINRGKDISNKKIGYVKMQILNVDSTGYKIRFANFDGSDEHISNIKRDTLYNYKMFSFGNGGEELTIEPPRKDWDFMFTKFIAFLKYNNSLLPYGVTGIIINHTEVSVYSDSLSNYSDINLNTAENYNFSANPGYIGHEWKDFHLNGEVYSAKTYMNYVLKDNQGFYWKFRFIDFYNDEGLRGYPKFEFRRL